MAGAVALVWSAWIHLDLWAAGYRNFVVGPLFMAQGIVAIAAALALVLVRRAMLAMFGAGLLVCTAFGLLLSHWIGLFGFHEQLNVPYAAMSLMVEFVGGVILVTAGYLLWRERMPSV
jgi:hypothetical protein